MINKKSYRQYLEQRMDRLTPVLENYENVTVFNTIPQKNNHRGLLFSLIGAVVALAIASAILIPLSLPATKKNWVMSLEERDYMAAKVYNAAVKNDDSIAYSDYGWESNKFRDDSGFYYETLTVVDSYYIQASFQSSLAGFFDDSIIGEKIDMVVALIDLAARKDPEKEEKSHIRTFMLILSNGDAIHGFLSGSIYYGDDKKVCTPYNPSSTIYGTEEWACALDFQDHINFSSGYFLSTHHYVSDANHDGMVDVDLYGNSTKTFTMKTSIHNVTKPNQDVSSTLFADTYKQMGKEETIDLISQTTLPKLKGTATIQLIDKECWALSVTSKELPSLKTITFSKLIADGKTYVFDPEGLLKEGSLISYDYYERFENYAPTDLFSTEIRLK